MTYQLQDRLSELRHLSVREFIEDINSWHCTSVCGTMLARQYFVSSGYYYTVTDSTFKCMRVVICTVDNCSCTPPPTTNTHTKQQYFPDESALHLEEEDHAFFHTVSPHINC